MDLSNFNFHTTTNLAPDPNAIVQQAIALHRSGKRKEGVELLQKALQADSKRHELRIQLGKFALMEAQPDRAAEIIAECHQLGVDHVELDLLEGNLATTRGQLDLAVECFTRAIPKIPNRADALAGLGIALAKQEHYEQALEQFNRALQLAPQLPELHMNVGRLFQSWGKLPEALDAYRRCLSLRPNFQIAVLNLSMVLLQLGNLRDGFRAFEARATLPQTPKRAEPRPRWTGQNLVDKTLLLRSEQGFGDVIQFARYAPILKEQGATIILECHSELKKLMQTVKGIDQVITTDEPVPAFDYFLPLMSCPMALGTTIETIPTNIPYIVHQSSRADAYKKKLDGLGAKKNIGIAWAGRPTHPNDLNRSMHAKDFAPLSKIKGIRLVSLQKGDAAEQLKSAGLSGVVDASKGLKDFHETACLIGALDLLITVDTAVAHLAGAMGKEVWVLLPKVPDWRWIVDRDDSPWYPGMRLFRQSVAHQWDDVIAQVAGELAALGS